MTGDFPIWSRHETRPLVKAYNSFAVVLVTVAFIFAFLLIVSQSSLLMGLSPIFVVAVFLGFIYIKDVRPELRRSSDGKVDHGSGLTEVGTARRTEDYPDLPLNRAVGRQSILHSRVVGILFLTTWLAWFLSFDAFLNENSVIWGMGASTLARRSVITSSEPMLGISVVFLASAMVLTAYAEWRKLVFPLYPIEGLWKSSLDSHWFARFSVYSVLAELVLFMVGLYDSIAGCLSSCSTPGSGVVVFLSALILPMEIAAVDVAACSVLWHRSRMGKWRVPASYYVATISWSMVGVLALYAFWAVVSNPLP